MTLLYQIVATLILVALAVTGLALGALFGRKPLVKGCGREGCVCEGRMKKADSCPRRKQGSALPGASLWMFVVAFVAPTVVDGCAYAEPGSKIRAASTPAVASGEVKAAPLEPLGGNVREATEAPVGPISKAVGVEGTDPSKPGVGASPEAASGTSLEDDLRVLAGGLLKARLPRGVKPAELEPDRYAAADPQPGLLARTVHRVAREGGALFVSAYDTGLLAGSRFAPEVLRAELAARQRQTGDLPTPEAGLASPPGLEVVAYLVRGETDELEPPEVRLWVRGPDDVVVVIELACWERSCQPISNELLRAFLLSLEPGKAPSAPAGKRVMHLSLYAELIATVPEGVFLEAGRGEDTVAFSLSRRREMGSNWEGASFVVLNTRSESSLRADYFRHDEEPRAVRGRVAGRSTTLLEIERGGRLWTFGRIDVDLMQLDAAWTASDAPGRRMYGRIVARSKPVVQPEE